MEQQQQTVVGIATVGPTPTVVPPLPPYTASLVDVLNWAARMATDVAVPNSVEVLGTIRMLVVTVRAEDYHLWVSAIAPSGRTRRADELGTVYVASGGDLTTWTVRVVCHVTTNADSVGVVL